MDENISGADLEESHFHHTIMEFCNLADKYGLDYMAYKSNDLRLELIKYMTSSDDDSYEWDDVYTGEEVYDSGMAYDD